MKALVGCPNYLALVDTATKKYEIVLEEKASDVRFKGEFYGISWDEDSNLCLTRSNFSHSHLNSTEDYIQSERGYVSYGKEISGQSLSGPHQLLYHKGKIIVANTGRNCLTIYNTSDLFYKHIWLNPDIKWDRLSASKKTGSHYNSVHIKDNKIYVAAHNWNSGSFVAVYTYPEFKPCMISNNKGLKWIHNIWHINDSAVLTCNSQHGTLVNIVGDKVLWKSEDRNFLPRGLAANKDTILIGKSIWHKKVEDRRSSNGGMWIIDKSTMKTIDYIEFNNSGGVNEIRIVDEPDECHNGLLFDINKL